MKTFKMGAKTEPPKKRPEGVINPDVVTLTTMADAQALLRAAASTRQAGFTAERIPQALFKHRPILFDDGPGHDAHRKELVRFFAPKVLKEKYGSFIDEEAKRAVTAAAANKKFVVDELALEFSVKIASEIVGLTHGSVSSRAKRLTNFFRQPPVDHTLPNHGRSNKDWARAAFKALGPLISFYFFDVRPAISKRRKKPQDDIISHLIARGMTRSEILMECLTYGTAGMVTTREFITVALWHLLSDDDLKERYLVANELERSAILHEIIRLDPPVGHLYRRVLKEAEGCPFKPQSLVDINVRQVNLDESVFKEQPTLICPERDLRASEKAGLSFGDGSHRCPGAPLAILETDVLLLEILSLNPTLVSEPVVEWDTLIEGYKIRNLIIAPSV